MVRQTCCRASWRPVMNTQSKVCVHTQLEGFPESRRPVAGCVAEGFGGHRDGAVRVRLQQKLRAQGVPQSSACGLWPGPQQSALDTVASMDPLRHLSSKHISSTADETCFQIQLHHLKIVAGHLVRQLSERLEHV